MGSEWSHGGADRRVSDTPSIQIDGVHRVFDDGAHNAFTYMTLFRGRYYLCFRSCPEGHMLFTTSRIRVLVSDDGISEWTQVCEFQVPERDVRDPHLLEFDDKLFVYSGAWLVTADDRPRDLNDHLGFAAWTADGAQWHGPRMAGGDVRPLHLERRCPRRDCLSVWSTASWLRPDTCRG
jgi:hypothetical protein